MNDITSPSNTAGFFGAFRNSIWFIGIGITLFNVVGKGVVALSDGYFSTLELTQLLTAILFLVAWFCLKPQSLVVVRAIVRNSNSI